MTSTTLNDRIVALAAAGLALACVLAATAAQAQSMSTAAASYNAGYGRNPGSENRGVSSYTRDANGNRVIIDGVIQTGADQSVFYRAAGVGSAYAGAGASTGAGSTAIGNNLVVITQGNWNTVIVDSTQINNGDVTANADLNGEVSLDGPN